MMITRNLNIVFFTATFFAQCYLSSVIIVFIDKLVVLLKIYHDNIHQPVQLPKLSKRLKWDIEILAQRHFYCQISFDNKTEELIIIFRMHAFYLNETDVYVFQK